MAEPSSISKLSFREGMIALTIFVLALLLRLPVLFQSLWYDEMYTLLHYIAQPWRDVVAGQYSPNNHVLFTLLAKLIAPDISDTETWTICIRLPSLIAGSLLPLALAWPFRREKPVLAVCLAIAAAVHPWLISFSGWARGYALLLLLAVLATNLLPRRRQIIAWPYAILLTAALYTQPVAVGLVVGHAAAMLLRRELFWTWLRSAAVAGVLTALLYLPFAVGAKQYLTQPERPSITYGEFVDQSFRYAHAGQDIGGASALLVPILILLMGGVMAWDLGVPRVLFVSFGGAALFGLLFPLLIPIAGEVRAMGWLIPLYCICAASVVATLWELRPIRWLGVAMGAILLALSGMASYLVCTTPSQPIRDGIEAARRHAGESGQVIGVYMGSLEARVLYGLDRIAYRAGPASPDHPLPSIEEAEAGAGKAIAIVFYEQFVQRDAPELWRYLQEHYEVIQRLPGRISPATVYRHR